MNLNSRLVIAQPWFTAPGHPAQSLLRTYGSIKARVSTGVIISKPYRYKGSAYLDSIAADCKAVPVFSDRFLSCFVGELGAGTWSIAHFLKRTYPDSGCQKILFLDANLYVLSASLVFPPIQKAEIYALCMVSPGFYQRNLLDRLTKWPLVRKLFRVENFRLLLRTQQLVRAWHEAIPQYKDRIGYLPSLELANSEFHGAKRVTSLDSSGRPRVFLVSGQIRPQKNVIQLMQLFSSNKSLGRLLVAGKVVSKKLRAKLNEFSCRNIRLVDSYLTGSEMSSLFESSDYNLMLYSDWDDNMESAMLYEALRHGCPTISFRGGWLGTIVETERLGWTVPAGQRDGLKQFLGKVPAPGTHAYREVCMKIRDYFYRLSSSRTTDLFLEALKLA